MMLADTKNDYQMKSFTAVLILTAVRTELHTVLLLATQLVPSLVPEHVNSSTTTMVQCLKDKHIFLKISSIKLLF